MPRHSCHANDPNTIPTRCRVGHTGQQPPVNPLLYMEVLEQACASGWILASEEIHHLIGVHPTCPKGQDSFRRGNWVFTKTGKLGGQTVWRVSKDVAEP